MKKIVSILLIIVSLFTCLISGCFEPYVDYANVVNNLTINYMSSNVTIKNKLEYRYSLIRNITEIYQGSGVIFKKELLDSTSQYSYRYYVLTNNHVIAKIVSSTYGSPLSQTYSMQDYKCQDITNVNYVTSEEVTDDIRAGYDLGVLSFESNETYKVITISTSTSGNSSAVFSIGQPDSQKNAITIGKITNSASIPPIISNEDGTANQYSQIKQKGYVTSVLVHSAYMDHGSSGGALLNSNCQLVGINYAGSTLEDGTFSCGYSVPAKDVLIFIQKIGLTI